MKVTHIYEDGTRNTQEMGCFGACGRADSRGVRDEFDKEAVAFSRKRGIGIQAGDWESSSLYHKPVRYIALSEGFYALFHVNNQHIMQYLIDESPYKVCFDQPYADVYKQNEVRVLTQGIPSEVTLSCLFLLRRIAYGMTMNTTFVTLSEHCTKWMALITARMFPMLGVGNLESEFSNGGDGQFFYHEGFSRALIHHDDPFSIMALYPRSVDELGGYIMNIRKMWFIDADKDTFSYSHVDLVSAKYSTPTTVRGIFGDFTTQQVTDIPAFLNDLWGTK